MAVLNILKVPDPRLKVQAEKVHDINSVQTLIDDMLETLYATSDGIALAATQVGRKEAVVVIDLSVIRNEPLILINPEVIGANKSKGQKDCLSAPDNDAKVERYEPVIVAALDRNGDPFKIEIDESLAIVLQHEVERLSDNLFINYLSPLKRSMALKKIEKR